MPPTPPSIIRGRCACGRRYRVRNARVGVSVNCPQCGRTITINSADLRVAEQLDTLAPLSAPAFDVPFAMLLDDSELRPAEKGSRPGLTGATVATNQDANLAAATTAQWSAARWPVANTGPATQFLRDLRLAFIFGGRSATGLMVGACGASLGVSLWGIGRYPAPEWIAFALLGWVTLLILAFVWSSALREAARGAAPALEIGAEWSIWRDAFTPLLLIALLSSACGGGAFFLTWTASGLAAGTQLISAVAPVATSVGLFPWPALILLACTEPRSLVRLDRVIDRVVRPGPAYLIVWLLCISWARLVIGVAAAPSRSLAPALFQSILPVYFGFVTFYATGLLARHFPVPPEPRSPESDR